MDPKEIDEKLAKLWKQTAHEDLRASKEKSWERFEKEVFQKEKTTPWYKYAVAASFALLIGIGAWWYNTTLPIQSNEFAVGKTLIKNPGDNMKIVILPDSSKVELAAHAGISYPDNFAENRRLHLEGKAVFEVTKDKQHPFRVHYKKTTTTVLGTTFSIGSDSLAQVEVKLYEGSVQMSVEGSCEHWLMAPGEAFTLQDDNVRINSFNRFVRFKNAPLKELVAYVKDTYGYQLVFQQETLLHNKITLQLNKREKLDQILEILSTLYRADYQKNRQTGKVYFNSKPYQK